MTLVLPLVGAGKHSRPEGGVHSTAGRPRWHGRTWLCWNAYALVCSWWFVGSAVTHNWIESAFAVLAMAGCLVEGRNCKRRYERARRSTYLDEPSLPPAVSALTPPWTAWAPPPADEWSVDTHDDLGNALHACSRGERCPHVRVQATG